MRVYLPGTVVRLRALARGGTWPPGPGHAVTDRLRRADPEGDIDAWEFAAFCEAADASAALLAGRVDVVPRRVVISADVAEADVTDDAGRGAGAVTVGAPVARAQVAAVHVDDDAAGDLVRRVAGGEPVSLLGDTALAWYDPSELESLLASLDQAG